MDDCKFWITDWHGNHHEMTPGELLKRIRNDSKSNWGWLAPATEIVKTISEPGFPEPIANELKGLILKCFAMLLLCDVHVDQKNTDQLAVAYCYYSIHGKAGKKIKRLYQENLLTSVIMHPYWSYKYGGNSEEWYAFNSDWKKDALQCFTKRFGVDFMRLGSNIVADYKKSIHLASEAGAFNHNKAKCS